MLPALFLAVHLAVLGYSSGADAVRGWLARPPEPYVLLEAPRP